MIQLQTKYKKYIFLLFTFVGFSVPAQAENLLMNDFKSPKVHYRPYVWWHWMGSNFSKEGITKDLEAMKEQGIGGATIFNIASAVQETQAPTLNNPWPEQTYRSPKYWAAMRHAAEEAKRLGLELGLHNSVGYSTMGGPWVDQAKGMQRIVMGDTTVAGGDVEMKLPIPYMPEYKGWGSVRTHLPKPTRYVDLALFAYPASKQVDITQIRDISNCMDKKTGKVICKLPQGEWTIVRYGYAPTMSVPHPLPDDLIGKALEVDKMSVEKVDDYWQNMLQPLCSELKTHVGKSFKHILIDSYEAELQSWTESFKRDFIKRKGYDPSKWILTGGAVVRADKKHNGRSVVVNSDEETARFEWDYKDVIAQLFFERAWELSKKSVNKYGMTLWHEPYGGPFNTLDASMNADIPMGEFWTSGGGAISESVTASARAMRKQIVAAEAFTGSPTISRWTEDPAFLKYSADGCFASGANRLVLHHWVHQPFDDRYQPGMGMGWWGTHFGRNQTWAEPGKAFFSYLSRCQMMLQQGEGVGDYLCVDFAETGADAISSTYLLNAKVEVVDNQIVLPSGRKYPFIYIKGNGVMLPELAIRIKELLSRGAVIVCPRPTTSPSLKEYPRADAKLQEIAKEVWDAADGNKWRKGYLFTKKEEALEFCHIQPDLLFDGVKKPESEKAGATVRYTHRYTDNAHIYFIANRIKEPQRFSASFRITGYDVQLWNPEDGSVKSFTKSDDGDRTTLSLEFTPQQAYFVVFTKQKNTQVLEQVQLAQVPTGIANSYISQWQVEFTPKMGTPFTRTFARLNDFSKHSDPEILYFSGTATYTKEIEWSKKNPDMKYILDLGEVNDIASVSINSSDEQILWYPPFRADITQALREGKNKITVKVTNNWANALIGDEQLPEDFEYGINRGKSGRAIKGYPDWFVKGDRRPTNRKTFVVWQYFQSDSELYPAGLVGPVKIEEFKLSGK